MPLIITLIKSKFKKYTLLFFLSFLSVNVIIPLTVNKYLISGAVAVINVRLICVGKLKEKFYEEAEGEYLKRLSGYCRFDLVRIKEQRLSDSPSDNEIATALEKEAAEIIKNIPNDAFVIPLCIEGRELNSEKFAKTLNDAALSGTSKFVFIIGGSFGLSETVKAKGSLRLSMSPMTFPHHLAEIMLLEQLYRAFKILEGSKYHK